MRLRPILSLRATFGEGSSMLGAPKNKNLDSAGPMEEKMANKVSGLVDLNLSGISSLGQTVLGIVGYWGKQEEGHGDLTWSPGPDFRHGSALDHRWSLELTVPCPKEWSLDRRR